MTLANGYLDAGGRRLEALWHGPPPDAAPTLVFLHQGLGCAAMWGDFPDKLAAATGCGALVYSRLGYGASDQRPLPWPITYMHEEALDILPEVLAAAAIRDCVLVGHSDGGSIALVYAGTGPAPGLRGVITEAAHVFLEQCSVDACAAALEAYANGDLKARLARYHGANTDCAFHGWADSWINPDFWGWNLEEYLPGVRVPALVIQGEDDAYGTPAQVAAIAAKAGGATETLMLPDCGHIPHREQEPAVLDAMAAFVGRVLDGGG